MNSLNIKDKEYIANTYNRYPVNIVKGEGSSLFDEEGKEYIDLGSGIGVTAFGFNDEEYILAVTEQLKKVQHTSNLYYTAPQVKLAEMIAQKTGLKKAFFSNSGAEANECAIKAARKWASENKGEDYYKIITLKNSFHGRTITTLSATGQDSFHKLFLPLTEGFLSVEANDISAIKNACTKEKVAAVMIELIQGEGGVLPLDKDYVKELYDFTKQNNILLIVDEVQTGNGRTGKLYCFEHFGIKPDIFTTAKGLGGGLPIGLTMLGEKVENIFSFGDHGSTFGGNPVAAAAAVNIISRIDEKLLNEVTLKSQYIFESLKDHKGVKDISGIGLMIGIETKKDAKEIVKNLINKGVLVLTAKEKIRLLPALNIPFEQLKKAIEIIKTEL